MLAVLIPLVLAITACGGNSAKQDGKPAGSGSSTVEETQSGGGREEVTLTAFLFNMDKREALEETFKQFTEAHPNITVDLLVNDQDYYTVLKAKIAAKQVPDIVMGEYGDLYELGQAGHILDLAGEPFVGNYSDTIRAQITTPEGHVYGVPLDVSGMGMYYNKDLLKKAGYDAFPKTQSELAALVDALKKEGIVPFAVSAADGWTLAHMLFTAIAGTTDDVKALAESVKSGGSLVSDRLVKAFDTLDLIYGNADPQASTNNYNASLSLLAQGKAAMLQQGYWAYSSILSVDPDVNIGMAAIPYSDNPEDARLGVNVNVSYAISSESKHQEEAKQLLAWLTSPEGNQIANELMKQIPAIPDVKVSSNPVADDILSYVGSGKVVPWSQVLMNGATRVAAEEIMQKYYFGKIGATEAIDELAANWAK